ncbi:MAG: PEGA domain-containing protein [Myxococcales bacterium]|nr:PEGA domain-containing protein [Myxococcales bacterium]
MNRRWLALGMWALCVALGLTLVGEAAARSHRSRGGSTQHAVVESELDAALAALDAGRFSAAEQALVRAYAGDPRPELLFYLGRLAAAQGHGLLARDLMRRYLQDPERENHAERHAMAQRVLDEPPPAGVLQGEVTVAGPRGAWLRIDGKPMGVLPLLSSLQIGSGLHPISLDIGSRRLAGEVWVTARFASEVRFNLDAKTVFSSAPPPLLALIAAQGSGWDDAATQSLFAALQEAGKSEGLYLLSRRDALQVAGDLAPCLDTLRCQQDLAIRNEAMGVLRLQLETQDSAAKSGSSRRGVQAQFVDLVAGQILSTVKDSCEACSVAQVGELAVQAALRSYREAWARPRGRLTLSVRPESASLRINGRKYQKFPVVIAPLAGDVSVEASAAGFRSSQRHVTVRENQATSVEIALDADASASAMAAREPGEHAPTYKRVLFWGGVSSVAVGVILAGFGVSGLAIHGQCGAGDAASPLCPQIYDTQTKGGVLLGLGLGLAAVGTVGIVWGREAVQRRKH